MNMRSLYPNTFNQLRVECGVSEIGSLRSKAGVRALADQYGVEFTDNPHHVLGAIEAAITINETKEAHNEGQRTSTTENTE